MSGNSVDNKNANADYLRQRSNRSLVDSYDFIPREPNVIVEEIKLKKSVGLLSGVALLVGTMIGSGIFISPKGVLSQTESVGLSLIVWTGCGVLSLLGALCYAELGTMITKSGGEYAYLFQAYGPIIAYLYAWTSIVVIKTSSVAIICLAFADYIMDPVFDDCGPPVAITKMLAAVAIVTVTLVNCASVKLAARVQVTFMFIKLAALAIIIIGGIVRLAQGETQHLQNSFEGSTTNPSKIALAFYSGLWAYDGWNNLNIVTEEIENPSRTLPLAIGISMPVVMAVYLLTNVFYFTAMSKGELNLPLAICISMPLVMAVYLLTNVSYFTAMSKDELLDSPAVAALWGERILKSAAIIMPISVGCSTFGAANGSAFTTGRITYVSSREGHLPEVMSYVSVKRYTPLPSLILNMIISLLMIIPGDIGSLIDFFSFTSWIFYGMTVLALIVLRFKDRDAKRPYKVPIPIPILFFLCCVYLVIGPIVDEPKMEFLYAGIFVIGGLVLYFPFVHFKLRIPGIDWLTTAIQLLAEVSPTQYSPDD